ncbi:hypothetical protein PAI11_03080 [Patulibacter medicamentivorans]|uniref:Uncharacterized protein n=1 Tax=Patulibacter medicamentivorans TaxID=1097667 RepID=H0E0K0_9ACTN|nr:hypothetical protein PAI11_03080 [Patulibacter medicamentivorans]
MALLRDPRARRAIGLRPAWRNRHWVLYRFTRDAPLLIQARDRDGDPIGIDGFGGDRARVSELTADRVVLRGTAAGDFALRVRYSPFLEVKHGSACLSTDSGGWTHVRLMVHGTVTLGTGLPGPWRRAQPANCDR